MRALAIVSLGLLLCVGAGEAQTDSSSDAFGKLTGRGDPPPGTRVSSCLPCVDRRALPVRAGGVLQTRSGTRSPVLAGALSFVLPGLGSFYAGHVGHGVRHLVAIPAIVGATLVAIALADQDGGEIDSGEVTAFFGGILLLTANGVWSIVTAVSDAQAYNARSTDVTRSGLAWMRSDRRVGVGLRYTF